MDPLTKATPKANVLLWKAGTLLYALVLFLNHNTEVIACLKLESITEERIKIAGMVIYALFTYFNFSQKTSESKKSDQLIKE